MRHLMVFVLLLLLPILGSADPGPATRFLRNEPASMFDIGMLKLQIAVNEMGTNYIGGPEWMRVSDFDKYGRLFTSVRYREVTDEIIITTEVRNPGDVDNESGHAYCVAVVSYFRTQLAARVGGFFGHASGFNASGQVPHSITRAILKRVIIRCKAYTDEGRPWVKGWVADGMRKIVSGVVPYTGPLYSGDNSEFDAPLPPALYDGQDGYEEWGEQTAQ